ncbi:unnamed protein product [Diatraea saccharalis]|uniref:Uncharacterized protein n=1 Tax=Diatraea saccharalis TaxID=40085 RepID=A0A9N9WIT9_9NEOP|nr:unnamed protein product [Diatraea saccharalis]
MAALPTVYCQFFECHDDPSYDPQEGPLSELQFTWLGALQYIHGNVAFGDYERDETECRVSFEEMAHGAECDPAVLLMPIADVLLHPEYKHFGAKNSLAILKLITPIKSNITKVNRLAAKEIKIEKEKPLSVFMIPSLVENFKELNIERSSKGERFQTTKSDFSILWLNEKKSPSKLADLQSL